MGYLIDSNAIIDYLSGVIPAEGMIWLGNIINESPIISVMTKIEVLGFKNPTDTEVLLNDFIDACIIVPLSEETIDQTIQIRKKHKIKTPDAIIAASAKVLALTLISRNITDFKKINGLKVIDPWEINSVK
ncbi:type II toxin-antitoxin system VapC family toxin [Mucilaginibacter flavus]|uniref:type II toxin-antitoxin system VapC family toxin n=1 Tax=Mucilaginibacter flavus TaxID=931504 RepID=UPI0025B5A38D|nr:type II toxin-antitoxin system VapC family toxin [Mucilaginibacter flavus]MDN3579370.1 type II toxin-antitoxin system VapC family toxin [Mucilaginibacter flavus]